MKSRFFGFYAPTDEEYQRLWRDATIVLDTNVLLNFYRLPTSAQNEFLDVLDLLKERLWIPHQVALEFQRNRIGVIASAQKTTEEALASVKAVVGKLRKTVDGLEIEKRGLDINTKPILDSLDVVNSKLISAIETVHNSQLGIATKDPVRDRLDEIFNSRVGDGPKDQKELDDLVEGGESRFANLIPPGFSDAEKSKNPKEAEFIHDHLKYQRKFGDLIVWRQILRYAKSNSIKHLLFVTDDNKIDWWWREQGKTLGPHSELISEIKRYSGVELFWMYSTPQFFDRAAESTTAIVSDESVKELQEVATSSWSNFLLRDKGLAEDSMLRNYLLNDLESDNQLSEDSYDRYEAAVKDWIPKRIPGEVYKGLGAPDFVVKDGMLVHGVDIKIISHFDKLIIDQSVINALQSGHKLIVEGGLTGFTVVLVLDDLLFFEMMGGDEIKNLKRRMQHVVNIYPQTAMVVGGVVGDDFEDVAWALPRLRSPKS